MREPYWNDTTAALYAGDAREVLGEFPDRFVDCVVTSPPPWTPESNAAPQDPSPMTAAATPSLYIAALRRVMTEIHRVLADHGTCWLITTDRYASHSAMSDQLGGRHRRRIRDFTMTGPSAISLLGLPWHIATALRDDGWIIRNAIVWQHPTVEAQASPDRRLLRTYEMIFLLVKQPNHHFAPDVLQDPPAHSTPCRPAPDDRYPPRHLLHCRARSRNAAMPSRHFAAQSLSGNLGDVWVLPARPFWHTLPIEVPLLCIAAGCRPGGTVLDPFSGIATTGLAARELDRSFIGIETHPVLRALAKARLEDSPEAPGQGPQ